MKTKMAILALACALIYTIVFVSSKVMVEKTNQDNVVKQELKN